MKYSELERILKKQGCIRIREGSHTWWYSPLPNKEFQTSHHKNDEVKPGTFRQIIKDSGVKL